jgi:hypothetical protein
MKNKAKDNILNNLYLEFKKTLDQITSENWKDKFSLFLDTIIEFECKSEEQRIVLGWLSSICEKIYFAIAHKKDLHIRNKFEEDFKEIISSKNLPKFMYLLGPVLCGKRQPSFVESIDSTFERYRVMEELSNIFGPGVEGIIIGGSMSYGPFYSVRDNILDKDFSDIDGLVVVNDSFFDDGHLSLLSNTVFRKVDNELFSERVKLFKKLFKSGFADVLSQRFFVQNKYFNVSLHFFPKTVFEKMVYTDLKETLNQRVDFNYVMKDFRIDDFTHPCLARHTFNGGRYESVVENSTTEKGYISLMPGFTFVSGKLYPGVYHTVIYPSFLVFYDKNGYVTDIVKKFEKMIYMEVESMRKDFPYSTYSKAHNRYDIFAPGRFEEGKDLFIAPNDLIKYSSPPDFLVLKNDVVNIGMRDMNGSIEKNKMELELWKKQVFSGAKEEIQSFLNDENSASKLKTLKESGKKYYSVCKIEGKKIKVQKFLRSEITYVKIISARDIMKFDSYEELSKKYGRVFVASVFDSKDTKEINPKYYELIIRT